MSNKAAEERKHRARMERCYGVGAWAALLELANDAQITAGAVAPLDSERLNEMKTQRALEMKIASAARKLAKSIADLTAKCPEAIYTRQMPELIGREGVDKLLKLAKLLDAPPPARFAIERAVRRGRGTEVFRAAVAMMTHQSVSLHQRFLRPTTDEETVYMPEDVKEALCYLTGAGFDSIKQTVVTSGFENVLGLKRTPSDIATATPATVATESRKTTRQKR